MRKKIIKNRKSNCSRKGLFFHFVVRLFHFFVNVFHIAIIVVLFCFIWYVVVANGTPPSIASIMDAWVFICSATLTDVYTFFGAITIVLFGIIGIYEYAYSSRLHFLVPPAYIHLKERQNENNAKQMMKVYYEKDLEFIQQYEAERVKSVLAALKINDDQFQHISYEIVRARAMPTKKLCQLQEKAINMLLNKQFIQDTTKLGDRRVYDSVNYYLNLYTAFYDPQLRRDAGSILTSYIAMCMDAEALKKISYIVIPSGSNLLLGLDVGERLGKKTICMLGEPRFDKEQPWDGEYVFDDQKGINHILILHDVLVSGERIVEVAKRLPLGTFQLDGLFCLIKYKHEPFHPEKLIVDAFKPNFESSKIHCLLSVDEDRLEKVMNA